MDIEGKWIFGSVAASLVFGAAILVYGIVSSIPPSKPFKTDNIEEQSKVVKFDKWVCVKGRDARHSPYEYSRNIRNGASGPASLACQEQKETPEMK